MNPETMTRTPDPAALRRLIGGTVIGPEEEGWDAERGTFNLNGDQRPAMIALPASAEEVGAVVGYAADNGLRVAPQRTGHNADPMAPLDESVLLKTTRLDQVEIDPASRRARVGAGARWEDVVPRASRLGLAALHGSTPDVSVAGYTLGGGMGWYARKLGLAANSVSAIEVVTADGAVRRVSHSTDPELFWALRGGGGNFGVVTALEFDLFPIDRVYAGVLFFPFERAEEVLQSWLAWTAGAPDEVTSVGRLLQFPPFEEIPEALRGNSFAVVEAAFLGSQAEGEELLAPLRALGPAMDTFAMVPPVELSELHMDPRDPMPYASAHDLLGELPATAITALVEAAGPGSGSTLASVEVRHTGGAMARPEEHHGALSALPGSFISFAVGVADADTAAKCGEDLARVEAATRPHRVGRYLNFTEHPAAGEEFFSPEVAARLRAVKRAYDPDHLFQANHEIGAGR